MNDRRHHGFTLLEILVVTAIIAVLLVIFVPAYSRSRAEARRMLCANNLIQIHRAMMMYAENNHSTFPVLASRPTINKDKASLRDTLLPTLLDERVFKCPDDKQGYFENEGASYEWNALLNDKAKDGPAESFIGPSKTPMVYDYENFHPDPGGGFGGKNEIGRAHV